MPIWSGGSGWSWPGFGAGGAGDPGRRGYTAGWFSLELDNLQAPVGFVTQIDGGTFRTDPVSAYRGTDQWVGKDPGKPKFDEFSIGIGMPNSVRLFNWVKSSIENRPERHSGALVGFDNFFNKRERSRRVFTDALISEITFPGLDAATASPANIILKIAPELLKYEQGYSTFNAQQARDESLKQKRWSTQNFGFRLDGFWGGGTQRNARIESFTIKQSILENHLGNALTPTKYGGRVEYPNLVVTFGEGNMSDWYHWYEDTLAGKITRRTGAITWLSADLRNELMRLTLDGVTLLNLEIERYEAGKEQIARAKATLAVEGMDLFAGYGTV